MYVPLCVPRMKRIPVRRAPSARTLPRSNPGAHPTRRPAARRAVARSCAALSALTTQRIEPLAATASQPPTRDCDPRAQCQPYRGDDRQRAQCGDCRREGEHEQENESGQQATPARRQPAFESGTDSEYVSRFQGQRADGRRAWVSHRLKARTGRAPDPFCCPGVQGRRRTCGTIGCRRPAGSSGVPTSSRASTARASSRYSTSPFSRPSTGPVMEVEGSART